MPLEVLALFLRLHPAICRVLHLEILCGICLRIIELDIAFTRCIFCIFGIFPDIGHDTDLACEGVGHPGELDGLGHVVPELLLGRAVHVRDAEVDGLVHQLALLPGDGLAALLAGPHLVTLLVSLPQSHAVLLGHVTTLRNLKRISR